MKNLFRNFESSWGVQHRIAFLGTLVVGGVFLIIALSSNSSYFIEAGNTYLAGQHPVTIYNWLKLPLELTYWPYHFLAVNVDGFSYVNLQVINYALALLTVVMFYRLLRIWFDTFYASVATLLFASSSWLVGVVISGMPYILLTLYTVALLFSITNIYRGRTSGFIVGSVTIPLSLYLGLHGHILGLMQLVLLVYVLKRRKLSRPSKNLIIASAAIGLMVIAPFIWLFSAHPQSIVNYTSLDIVRNVTESAKLLAFGSKANPFGWPSTWPLLDIATASMITLGLMVAVVRRKAVRYQILLSLLSITLLNFVFFGTSTVSLAFAIIPWYVLFASGLRYFNEAWRSVFPKNQAAYVISNLTIVLLFSVVASYHLVRFTDLLPQLQ